jgi:hypothetical protein
MRLTLILALLAAIAFLAFFAIGPQNAWRALAGPPDMGRYDFTTLPRHTSDNDALACSPGLCDGRADFDIPVHDAEPEDVINRLDVAISGSGSSVVRVDDRSVHGYARYVTHSPWMGFPDTTDIEALTLGSGRTGVRAYARAQIGRKDFGANATRLRLWLQ